jgi:hypothetical protein
VKSDETITCTRVSAEALDRRYLAGEMGDAEATAFERHYLACDECWMRVQNGAAHPMMPTAGVERLVWTERLVWILAALVVLAAVLRYAA